MTGGLIQLLAVGNQNFFLNGRPKQTFFKQELETHTHFAMESKSIQFNRTDANISSGTKLMCNLPRYGDLVSDIYLCFTLPPLYYDTANQVRVKWVQQIGLQLIDNMSITIGGSTIERSWGEWMSIYGSLSNPLSKQHLYNKMIGNTPDMFDPDILLNEIDVTKPFVKGMTLMVPLPFWFSRQPGCALPQVSLQYDFVTLNIDLRPFQDMYLINVQGQGYKRPVVGNVTNTLSNFNPSKIGQTNIEINPYIEVNYVFLDNPERDRFVAESQDYLVEQVVRVQKDGIFGYAIIELLLSNPVKEIVFFAQDIRALNNNDWLNTTNIDDGTDIIKTVKIWFNGHERLEEKPIEYFSLIQNWRYHSSSPKQGVYVYSFSLKPEQFQPSGECNMSKVNSVQVCVAVTPGVTCNMVFYATNYNFLRIQSGTGGIAFAL